MKPRAKLMAFVLTLAAVLVAAATLVLISVPATAAEAAAATVAIDPAIVRWGFIAAALAAGLSALAAGYAVAQVGTAAVGALAEKPELLGRVLILVGLAEGIAIYGLIVAILIFNRIG
ncbi:MAG: ATP synthase subunit C [Chromatiales bacterium]|jgi:V/A-type H+-transporting ATPase subunit K